MKSKPTSFQLHLRIVVFALILMGLYIFYYLYPTIETNRIKEQFQLLQCSSLESKNKCKTQSDLCNYDTSRCLNSCDRKQCKDIKTKKSCKYASKSLNPQKNAPCMWNTTICEDCPKEYIYTDPETQQSTCYKGRCKGLPKELCESPPHWLTCCWNKKKGVCERRDKK